MEEITTIESCDLDCIIKVDTEQVMEIYDDLSDKVYQDLNKQYKEKKINGATYATIYSDLMKQVIDGSLNAVIALQTKETSMDRCIKQEQCDSSKAKTVREDAVASEQITSSQAKTTRDDELADSKILVDIEQITSSKAKTTRDDELADSKILVDIEQITSSQSKTERDDSLASSKINVDDTDVALKIAQTKEIVTESLRKEELKTEQINSSQVKSNNETAMATTKQLVDIANEELINANEELVNAKEKAEDIKNGDEAGVGSLYEQNIATAEAQALLYERQKTGFDDNARQKVLDSQLSAWSVAYNSLDTWTLPEAVKDDAIDQAVNVSLQNIGFAGGSLTNDPGSTYPSVPTSTP